jgi:hypothetical protein
MMTYGSLHIKYAPNTLSIVEEQRGRIVNYVGTRKNRKVNVGQEATKISCQVIVESLDEMRAVRQALRGELEQNLSFTLYNEFYKRVIGGLSTRFEPETPDGSVWRAWAEFICLDPDPYNIDTGDVIY